MAAVALCAGMLAAAPAQADHGDPGEHVLGHRCRTYDAPVTNENTVTALIDTAAVPGVACEIDAIRIADGTIIVWHDPTWNRVANPSTLPKGVKRSDPVTKARWSQVSRIRTKGGAPVARLQDMIDAAGQYGIPLVVEARNSLTSNPAALVKYAQDRNADVSYYQSVGTNCRTGIIDRFRAAGAEVGVKLFNGCQPAPAQLAAKGVSFTQQVSFWLTDSYLAEMSSLGIGVGVLDSGMTEARAKTLFARGVSRVMLDRPAEVLTWSD